MQNISKIFNELKELIQLDIRMSIDYFIENQI